MRETFLTPLLLAVFMVGGLLTLSSFSTDQGRLLAEVATSTNGGTSGSPTAASIPVYYSVSVSSTLVCTGLTPLRTVGFFTTPATGGYFSLYGAGGIDYGDRQPGLFDLPSGTYSWEGKAQTGYMRTGTYAGTFTVSGDCPTTATTTAVTPPPPPPATTVTPTTTTGTVTPTPVPVTQPPVPTPPTTANLVPATFAVKVAPTCTLDKNMTQVALEISPSSGGKIELTQSALTTSGGSSGQGVQYLPNGTYLWRAIPNAGYQASGESSGTFTLGLCPLIVKPVVSVGSSCDLVEEGVPVNFGSSPSASIAYTLTDTATGENAQVPTGTKYLPNGSYTWGVAPTASANIKLDGNTSGTITVTSCKDVLAGSYVPPKPGTILFFRDGKLVDPIVLQGEKIAVRVDVSGIASAALELVGKDTRIPLGTMLRDGTTNHWLYAWSLKDIPPGEYSMTMHAKSSAGIESTPGSRIVTVQVAPSTAPTPSLAPAATQATAPVPVPSPKMPIAAVTPAEEFPDMQALDTALADPVFSDIGGLADDRSSLPVRGVADLISSDQILKAKNDLPDAINTLSDLRSFCADSDHDAVCLKLLPDSLRVEAQATLESARKEFDQSITMRTATDSVVDADHDGVSDYDETHFLGTDPKNADTDGDGKTDGDELLAHTDPLKKEGTTSKPIEFESPIVGGEERAQVLAVEQVAVADVAEKTDGSKDASKFRFSGKALPGSIVTLYVYSDPIIVSVKTGEDGIWTYTVAKELADGSHKAYVAMTDSSGRILAKSTPLPFVKQAAAVSLTPIAIPGAAEQAPSLLSGGSLYAFILILVGVIGFAIVAIGLIVRGKREEDVIQ